MEKRNIGKSGLSAPFLGLGTWAIGGGRWCHGQNITVTDAKLKLTTGYSRYISDEAAAMGYGDRVYLEKVYDIDVGKRYIR